MMVAETPPILDGHNDTLLHLYLPERGGSRTFVTRSDLGHIDLPRARDGGFGGGFFAVFVPSDPAAPLGNEADVMRTATGYEVRMAPAIDHAYARRTTIAMTASLFRLTATGTASLHQPRRGGLSMVGWPAQDAVSVYLPTTVLPPLLISP